MQYMEFIENIFSLKDYGETHKILRIFGIKVKFPKADYIKKRKDTPYDDYKKNNVDITKLPPATGQIRDIQLANLALLKELDSVCRKNDLKYWLEFGTLLGAIRHKGFIPWDDDIDVGMMREDYEKIIKAFEESSSNPDIYAEYTYIGKSQAIIKVKHKKCSFLFVDIFPHDYSNRILRDEARIPSTKELKKYREELSKNKSLDTAQKVSDKVRELNSEIIPQGYVEHSDIQCGLEYFYTEPVWIQPYETIFPLKQIEFEGFSAMCINKPQKYLAEIFGNYMAYPSKIGFGHSMYLDISKEKEIIDQLKKYVV